MNPETIKKIKSLTKSFEAEVKRASDLEAEVAALKAELNKKPTQQPQQKTASADEAATVDSLATRLIQEGFLAEENKVAFVNSVLNNPFSLVGVTTKIASIRAENSLLDLGTPNKEADPDGQNDRKRPLDKLDQLALERRKRG